MTAAERYREYECAEEERHRAERLAESEVHMWLFEYQIEHGLSDIDMLTVLDYSHRVYLRHIDRDDEERRTGFRHRLAGE